jgi:succinyl-diaminopimelate desuccinylase
MVLDVSDLGALFAQIVDIESVSGDETALADQVFGTLRAAEHLELRRDGNAVVASTNLGRDRRVIIAGHLDTVPVAGNLPSELRDSAEGPVLFGRGTADMKGGVAVMVALAMSLAEPRHDVTWVFYDNEEVASEINGLGRLSRQHADWLNADLAILMEPTNARIEGGCQGTMRFNITTTGIAAHSARSWLGRNAIHAMTAVLERVQQFEAKEITVEGLTYREGLNATMINGGVAGNVIPDSCTVQINYRFAPDKTAQQAAALMTDWFVGHDLEILDLSPAARPGLNRPEAAEFVAAVGADVRPKYGWTDVARFSELGIPALNYGPADPGKAHAVDECCPFKDLFETRDALSRWLQQKEDDR